MGRARAVIAALVAAPVLLTACAGGGRSDIAAPDGGDCVLIGVWSNGFHTSLALPGAMFEPDHPVRALFPDAAHFLIGYGEEAFYRDPDPTRAMAVRAAMSPSPGVLHVIAHHEPIAERLWRPRTLQPVAVSQEGLEALAADLAAQFAPAPEGAAGPAVVGEGHVPGASVFARAVEEFHLFHMCNQWTAARLEAAGAPAPRPYPFYADDLVEALAERAPASCPPR